MIDPQFTHPRLASETHRISPRPALPASHRMRAAAGPGELLGLACLACHKLGAGDGALVGPNLHGVFGRPAASLTGFDYSPALAASGLVWTPVSLEAWLADPAGFVAGTTMAFTGYRSAEDRRDLIAYLLRATQ